MSLTKKKKKCCVYGKVAERFGIEMMLVMDLDESEEVEEEIVVEVMVSKYGSDTKLNILFE